MNEMHEALIEKLISYTADGNKIKAIKDLRSYRYADAMALLDAPLFTLKEAKNHTDHAWYLNTYKFKAYFYLILGKADNRLSGFRKMRFFTVQLDDDGVGNIPNGAHIVELNTPYSSNGTVVCCMPVQ